MLELQKDEDVLLEEITDFPVTESDENSLLSPNSEKESDSQIFEDSSLQKENASTEIKNDDIPEPNCLALTIKKDYNLTVIRNIFTKTGRMSLRVALSTIFLNILKMFF